MSASDRAGGGHLHPQREGLAGHRLEGLDLHGDELRLVLPGVDPGLHDDDGVVGQLVAVVGHRLREHHDLDRGLQVLQDEHGHEVALAWSTSAGGR